MPEYAIRRKPGRTLRVDNLTEDRVEGYWNMRDKSWFPLDWLEAGQELVERDRHHEITIGYKCPMEGCGLEQRTTWSSVEFPSGLEGVSVGDTLEGPFHCPDCDIRGVAHSDLFEVTAVKGEPVNTDYDPLAVGDEVGGSP